MTEPSPEPLQPRESVSRRAGLLGLIGPGMLLAATGVGAGDLATAGFAGSSLGYAVLWAVVLGALLKFILNENLARWQIATGRTALEGAVLRLGWPVFAAFLVYLLGWSYFVGFALINACGATLASIIPTGLEPAQAGRIFGVACSLIGLGMVWIGGYRLFERVMAGAIVIMFFTVLVTAVLQRPDPAAVLKGLLVPTIPRIDAGGLSWTIALMGGVGGTLTVICYGYWMREVGRTGPQHLRTCRIDLASGYVMTAIFGVCMVIIAAGVTVQGSGVRLIANLADSLGQSLGPAGRWIFLLGAFAAVFSSLLGVWQAAPYVFADAWNLRRVVGRGDRAGDLAPVSTRSRPYRVALVLLATVPATALLLSGENFRAAQKAYAVVGAAFIPALALVMLVLNGRRAWVGERFCNRGWMTGVLALAVALFVVAAGYEIRQALSR